jgi:hypothetical protein
MELHVNGRHSLRARAAQIRVFKGQRMDKAPQRNSEEMMIVIILILVNMPQM